MPTNKARPSSLLTNNNRLSKKACTHGVLSGFNIMIDRQRQTKYSVSNDMARGAKGDYVTRVDVASPQG